MRNCRFHFHSRMSFAKCSSLYGNVIPGLERNRDGQISSLITHGSIVIPHLWLSSCDKIKFPHLRLRRGAWGNFISSRLLSHSWGIKIEPFVICEEIFFLYSWLRHSYRKKPIPISLQTGYRSYLSFII